MKFSIQKQYTTHYFQPILRLYSNFGSTRTRNVPKKPDAACTVPPVTLLRSRRTTSYLIIISLWWSVHPSGLIIICESVRNRISGVIYPGTKESVRVIPHVKASVSVLVAYYSSYIRVRFSMGCVFEIHKWEYIFILNIKIIIINWCFAKIKDINIQIPAVFTFNGATLKEFVMVE